MLSSYNVCLKAAPANTSWTSPGICPRSLAEGDVLRGDVRHVPVHGILAMPVGAELQRQALGGGQLVRAKRFPPVGVDAFTVTLRTSAMSASTQFMSPPNLSS